MRKWAADGSISPTFGCHAPPLPAGAALTGYLQKRQLEVAASAPPKKAAPLPAPKPAPPRPLAGEPGKPAVPTFKSTAPPKPAAAAKRQGGTKPTAAPLAPKAAKPARPAAAAAEGLAGAPEVDGTGAATAVQAIEHVTSAMAGGGEGGPVGAEGGAKPAKPRAPPKELVLEEVVKKVLACQATGKLSNLTIPEVRLGFLWVWWLCCMVGPAALAAQEVGRAPSHW